MTGTVRSADGTELAYYSAGDPTRTTVVAVHGYPDNHTVWDGVVDELAGRYHVVTYDVRGAGASDQPRQRSAYRLERLVEDLAAVLDAVSPDRPVHLLAHDWGSIQSWAAVTDPGFAERLASFTSISGPSLDHAAAWLRRAWLRHPGDVARQLLDSYYIGLFQVPGLAETAWRSGALDRLLALTGVIGRSSAAIPHRHQRADHDKINGLELYRANIGRFGRPRARSTDVPVQVLAPRHDSYVSAALQTQAPAPYARSLHTRAIAGGHWVVSDRPDVIARCVDEFAAHLDAGRPVAEFAPVAREGEFGGQLVLITGAGHGIGRATALEFATRGADVIIADIDDVAAKETVAQLHGAGARAWDHHLDVADRAAWEALAQRVRDEHGVVDVVVNNAGIGMSGPFLKTSVEQWQRVLDINLWSVIHGSRLFAAQMVERGEGGHVINVASAAAYAPSVTLPAYATTKAAVLMLTECLRAELAREDIGVTAICPGFVDSDITRSTTFVGVDDDTQDAMRDKAVTAYGRRGYTPAKVAAQVVRAAARNRPLAAITPESKVFLGLHRYAPALARRVARLDLNAL